MSRATIRLKTIVFVVERNSERTRSRVWQSHEIAASVSCYECVVAVAIVAQGCVDRSIGSFGFVFLFFFFSLPTVDLPSFFLLRSFDSTTTDNYSTFSPSRCYRCQTDETDCKLELGRGGEALLFRRFRGSIFFFILLLPQWIGHFRDAALSLKSVESNDA